MVELDEAANADSDDEFIETFPEEEENVELEE